MRSTFGLPDAAHISRAHLRRLLPVGVIALLAAACGGGQRETFAAAGAPEAIVVTTAAVVERPVTRYIHVSGTLAAQEAAEVAAEVAGRVVATPIERGSRVAIGAVLIQIADAEEIGRASCRERVL